MLKKVFGHFFQNKLAILLIFVGSLVWSLTLIRSGLKYSFGLGFWGPNAHDGIWHIALAESLVKGTLNNPIFAGYKLTNYHLGFDAILALLNKITSIPIVTLYFQIIPPILAVLVGILSYKLILSWSKSKAITLWSLFFIYFGGGFGFLVSLIRGEGLGGDSMFWIQSAATTLVNPPFALSLVILLAGLLVLTKYKTSRNLKYLIFSSLLFGILVQIKVYATVVVLGALFVASIFAAFYEKKYELFNVFVFSVLISLVLLFSISPNFSSLIVFYPFWFLENMMNFGDRFHWERFYQAMVTYKSGRIYLKAIAAYGVAFLIFIIGNLGTRMIGFLILKRWLKKFDCFKIFTLSGIIIGIIIPMFFLQKGTPWNTIQFSYYSVFFSAILAGYSVNFILDNIKSRILKYLCILLVIGFTITTTFATLRHYISKIPHSKISNNELAALNILRKEPKGTVLSIQLLGEDSLNTLDKYVPIPIYLYESTAYISAFSKMQGYFEDEVNLNILGYNWPERKEKIIAFLKNSNSVSGRDFLRNESIDYIYLIKRAGVGLDEKTLGIKNIFNNDEVIIYQVN